MIMEMRTKTEPGPKHLRNKLDIGIAANQRKNLAFALDRIHCTSSDEFNAVFVDGFEVDSDWQFLADAFPVLFQCVVVAQVNVELVWGQTILMSECKSFRSIRRGM